MDENARQRRRDAGCFLAGVGAMMIMMFFGKTP
jgi:hypothetical protein